MKTKTKTTTTTTTTTKKTVQVAADSVTSGASRRRDAFQIRSVRTCVSIIITHRCYQTSYWHASTSTTICPRYSLSESNSIHALPFSDLSLCLCNPRVFFARQHPLARCISLCNDIFGLTIGSGTNIRIYQINAQCQDLLYLVLDKLI